MNAVVRYLDSYRRRELVEASIDPDWLRSKLNPRPPNEQEVREASYAAQLLEEDRRHV